MTTTKVDLVVQSQRVMIENSIIKPASVHVSDGKIVAIAEFGDAPVGVEVIDAGDKLLLPGLVDTHVHINEPGRTAWEGFFTATQAAAAGGVTTVCDMPLNSIPPTTTVKNLEAKQAAAQGQLHVDMGFLGGVVPGSEEHIAGVAAAGIRGFKCFLCNSGVAEFGQVFRAELERCLPIVRDSGSFLMFHAELKNGDEACCGDHRNYMDHLASSDVVAEGAAVKLIIELCEQYNVRCHIVHLSGSDAVPLVREAKARGLPLTAETCPHYLTLAAEEVPDGATYFKCCPPIRKRDNQDGLWEALRDGTLDMVVSDHSPCTADLKKLDVGKFGSAWGGISSLQVAFTMTWTEGRKRGFSELEIVKLMSENPAKLVGLAHRKGAIKVGLDADFCVFDDTTGFTIDAQKLFHKNKLTPYDGRQTSGTVVRTILRGKTIYEAGKHVGAPSGVMLCETTQQPQKQ
eukprot:TRINITY_DN3540_c0_g2_i1.p1 TRINITY_DN3540_c0_g2~~TRINITY_DN3540_c0_g2_i1.p1  ORF type:complete len:458 (+),score=97.55 TRINITY_DN3540_c0_g2_i1:74-1447(+)